MKLKKKQKIHDFFWATVLIFLIKFFKQLSIVKFDIY